LIINLQRDAVQALACHVRPDSSGINYRLESSLILFPRSMSSFL